MNGHRGPCLLLQQALALLRCQILWFENYDKFLERPRERKWHFVHIVFHDWSSHIAPNVEGFIKGEPNPHRLSNASLRNRRPVHEQSAGCAFADTSSLIFEDEAHHVIASRDGLIGNDAEFVVRLIGKCVCKFRLAVLHQQRPTAKAAPNGGQDPIRPIVRDRDLGGYRPRLVLEVWRRTFGDAYHSLIVGELGAPARETRPDGGIGSRGETRIERIDVVL